MDEILRDPYGAAVAVICATLWAGTGILRVRDPHRAELLDSLHRFCGWLCVLGAGAVAMLLDHDLTHALAQGAAGLGASWLLCELVDAAARKLRPQATLPPPPPPPDPKAVR